MHFIDLYIHLYIHFCIDFILPGWYPRYKNERRIMPSVISAIQNTVPITQFNRGLAGKIFEEDLDSIGEAELE